MPPLPANKQNIMLHDKMVFCTPRIHALLSTSTIQVAQSPPSPRPKPRAHRTLLAVLWWPFIFRFASIARIKCTHQTKYTYVNSAHIPSICIVYKCLWCDKSAYKIHTHAFDIYRKNRKKAPRFSHSNCVKSHSHREKKSTHNTHTHTLG